MEFLLLVAIIGLLAIIIACREWGHVAHRQWLGQLELFNKRLAVYEALKAVAGRVNHSSALSDGDLERFARVVADMHFLFDKDLEQFARCIYDSLLKKRALDALLEQAARKAASPADRDLIERATSKSEELAREIEYGVYRELPARMERFMRPRPASAPREPALKPAPSAKT
jgi:hypothetical protein